MGDFFPIIQLAFSPLHALSRRVSLPAPTAEFSALANDTIWEKIEGKKHATITFCQVALYDSIALEPWDARGIYQELLSPPLDPPSAYPMTQCLSQVF